MSCFRIAKAGPKMTRLRGSVLTALIVVSAPVCLAQMEAPLNRRIDLLLEKKEGGSPRIMNPAHVFAEGDLIRFRMRSGVNGFLYVINRGSSGAFEQLFPRKGANQNRAVKAGREYVVPDSESGWFRIQGPTGYETVYFLVSPTDLGESSPGGQAAAQASKQQQATTDAFATATPRCDDELFRARGECLDSSAGLKPLQKGEQLPGNLSQIPAMTGRDLIVVKDSADTSVTSTAPFEAPVIYHFRIAHK
jgi:hypothetical protein